MRAVLFSVFLAALHAAPGALSAEPWVRISIKSAFVSQGTYEANRDFFSSPEFGWNVRAAGRLVMRGDLYGDLYAPAGGVVELVFVEEDIAVDDAIHAFPLKDVPGKHDLAFGEDRFTIEVSPYDPDAKSGRDAVAPAELARKTQDSVSFLEQDRTDLFKPAQRYTLLVPEFPSIEAGADGCTKTTEPSGRIFLFECSSPGILRVQSQPGAARAAYTVETAASFDALAGMLESTTRSGHLRGAAFSFFENLGRAKAEAFCSRQRQLTLCGYYLYRTGDRKARDALRKASPSAEYTEALEQAEQESPEP